MRVKHIFFIYINLLLVSKDVLANFTLKKCSKHITYNDTTPLVSKNAFTNLTFKRCLVQRTYNNTTPHCPYNIHFRLYFGDILDINFFFILELSNATLTTFSQDICILSLIETKLTNTCRSYIY